MCVNTTPIGKLWHPSEGTPRFTILKRAAAVKVAREEKRSLNHSSQVTQAISETILHLNHHVLILSTVRRSVCSALLVQHLNWRPPVLDRDQVKIGVRSCEVGVPRQDRDMRWVARVNRMHDVGRRKWRLHTVSMLFTPLVHSLARSMHRHDIPANEMTTRCGKTSGPHGTHELGALTGRIMVLKALKMTVGQQDVPSGRAWGWASWGGAGVPSR